MRQVPCLCKNLRDFIMVLQKKLKAMKKTFIMVCAAVALMGCNGKTAPSAADVVSDTVEKTVETAAVETAVNPAVAAAADALTKELAKHIADGDVKALAKTVADAKAKVAQLKSEGKLDEAEVYLSKIKEYVDRNKEAITKVAKGNVTVLELVNGMANLPESVEQGAGEAKAAVNSDAAKAESGAKAAAAAAKAAGDAAAAKVESDVRAAGAAAKAKVESDVHAAKKAGKQKAKEAAGKTVDEILNKALGE